MQTAELTTSPGTARLGTSIDPPRKIFPKMKQEDIQLGLEAINDWYLTSDIIDRRRPKYFYVLIGCWLIAILTGFDPMQQYFLWLIGRLGVVAVWFGSVSFFLLYANIFRQKRKLETLITVGKRELRAMGLDYIEPRRGAVGRLLCIESGAPFDPYDDRNFA